MTRRIIPVFFLLFTLSSCGRGQTALPAAPEESADPAVVRTEPEKRFTVDDIVIEKDLLYDQHTLPDTFPYGKSVRFFQFDKMRERLFMLDSIQQTPARWGVLQNRNNVNGESPLVKQWKRNEYGNVVDLYGVERRQAVGLYVPGEPAPERYGHDGSLVRILAENPDSTTLRIESYNAPGVWNVDKKYVKPLAGGVVFQKAVMVDRTNQDIATMERSGGKWLVRSMNPATTGAHNPPYAHPTPVGLFVIQEKKQKMYYTSDGGSTIVGYAPWASRFSNGGYLHGVPTNDPHGAIIEFSRTLGTIPRSHMCVRNASSHARFMFDWAPVGESVVFVYD